MQNECCECLQRVKLKGITEALTTKVLSQRVCVWFNLMMMNSLILLLFADLN